MDAQQKTQDQATVTLTDYLRFVSERWWVIVLVVVVFTGATIYLTMQKTPQYQASAEVIHQTAGWESTLLGINSMSYYYSQKVPVDARLLGSAGTAARVKTLIDSQRSPEDLLGMIAVQPLAETETIRVRAVSPDPAEAAAVANGFVQAFVASRKEDMEASLSNAKSVLEKQIQAVPATEREAAYAVSLEQRLRGLSTVADLASSDYTVLQAASVPGAPFTPQPVRDGLLAFGIALVSGIALAFMLEYLDGRIKDEDSMERVFNLPVLASIPMVPTGWSWRRSRSKKPGAALAGVGFGRSQSYLREPYMALRSNLQYFGVDKPLRMLMITSALPRHGKTTATVNLGLTMALAGQNVLLIECDLRRPSLHEYLGISNKVGLSSVLSGATKLLDSIQTVEVADLVFAKSTDGTPSPTGGRGKLWALCAGPLPPNPGELIASKRMMTVLEAAAEGGADFVILDTPPALLVADALTLARHVDGVLITARLRDTTRDQALRMRGLLERSGAHVLGVVVGSDKRTRHGGYAYGYGYGYGHGYGYDVIEEPSPAE